MLYWWKYKQRTLSVISLFGEGWKHGNQRSLAWENASSQWANCFKKTLPNVYSVVPSGCGRILTQGVNKNLKVKLQPQNKQNQSRNGNYIENIDLSPAYTGM